MATLFLFHFYFQVSYIGQDCREIPEHLGRDCGHFAKRLDLSFNLLRYVTFMRQTRPGRPRPRGEGLQIKARQPRFPKGPQRCDSASRGPLAPFLHPQNSECECPLAHMCPYEGPSVSLCSCPSSLMPVRHIRKLMERKRERTSR